jgi:glutamate-1-semialdehyde 2,1-aminomutase
MIEPAAPDFPPISETQRELLSEGEAALVGGAVGLFRLPNEIAFVARRGAGARLFDADEREFLDFLLGYGPLILGHAHPAVVEAVQQRAASGAHFYLINEEAIRLAQAIRAAVPSVDLVRFVGTGSEATFYALRLARAYTQRNKILKFHGAFHGTHDYVNPAGAGVPPVLREEVLNARFNDLESVGALIAAHAGELAAVIVEPMQRCVPPKPGFLQGLRELTQQHRVVLIFDEVITGFRLAYGGAQAYYGVEADLTCFGKIVGGGYPLAAVGGPREIMTFCDVRRIREPRFASVGGTLGGNPLCAAAGLATLQALQQPDTYERLHALGNRLRSGLEALGEQHGLRVRAVGEGTVFQPLITTLETVNGQPQTRIDDRRTYRFGVEMAKRGVLLMRTVFLCTEHTEADIDRALEVADQVLPTLGPNG